MSARSARPRRLTEDEYVSGILEGNRTVLARAITLVESRAPSDEELAQKVLERILPHAGRSLRIGISGVPGVGKSSLIEVLGKQLLSEGKRVAVLAVDPSSPISRGSILGDKTRMPLLAQDPRAFIRPSPSSGSLGGVARATREAMLIVEAANFDVILVETVGVGQSESAVRSMVDFFLLLMLAGAGDELQGIKRGLIELADTLAITKVDGDNLVRARRAQRDYVQALQYLAPASEDWRVEVVSCSAITAAGIEELWRIIQRFFNEGSASGSIQRRRAAQSLDWLHALVAEELQRRFYAHPVIQQLLPELEERVRSGELPPGAAVLRLMSAFTK
jgi:LAO/AO transport system kinase